MFERIRRRLKNFVVQDGVLEWMFLLFLVLAMFGVGPTILLAWKASGGFFNIWVLDGAHRWEQLLAIATVALAMATALLAIVGYLALFAAVHHVKKVETASRGELLLSLERQVTNQSMIEAQNLLLALFLSCHLPIKTDQEDLDHPEVISRVGKSCHQKLEAMRHDDIENYHRLFRNCEFVETIGIMVNKGYVDIEDVVSRFEVGIERVHACFNEHLKERRKESWASHLFFQHIEELYEDVRVLRAQKST